MRIKSSVKNTEPNQAGGGEQPKPGIYTGQIHEITYRTGRGNGKEDDLEVIYRILKDDGKPDGKYNRVWDYVGLEADQTEWKRAQFFEAIGEATETKREVDFDPREHCEKFYIKKGSDKNGGKETGHKGTKVKLRIKGDSHNGEYKAKIAAVLPLSKEALSEGKKGGGLFADDDDDEPTPSPAGNDSPDEPEEQEGTSAPAGSSDVTYDDVVGMKIVQLRDLADDLGIDHEGKRKSELRDEVLEELGLDGDDDDSDAPF